MSSVIGIDVGNSSSKIGAARARGVDILANEVSNRQTPSLISFGQKNRAIGEAAATMQTSNFKNTVGSLKRLLGRTFADSDVQDVEKKFINAELVDSKGEVAVKVRFQNEERVFSATQLMGMYLGKLRDTAKAELGGAGVSDVVVSVPQWYTDVQRRAMTEACEIAGLNPLRLLNDTTATALGYGITKTDLPEDSSRNVVFCDFGHSSYQVAVVAFSKGQLTVLGTASDRHFGGRDMDLALLNHFAEEFKGKYKIDVLSSPKAIFRLAAGCERLKKVLSANALAPLNVESIMEDIDASSQLKREEFEQLIAPLLEKVVTPLEKALAQAGLTREDIHSVEMVGGSSRVPALKERVSAFFDGKPLSFTSNQDEAIARGATLACATLSPVFRVREFSVNDVTGYPIKVTWEKDANDDDTELVVFKENNPVPSTKILTFHRTQPFTLEAHYANPAELPKGINPYLGQVTVKNVKPDANGNHAIVKVRIRLNLHSIIDFESAYTVEEVEKEEEVADPDAIPADGEAPPMIKRTVKKLQRKEDLPVVSGFGGKDASVVSGLKEAEGQMYANDKLVIDTADRKNALEEMIYDQRSKLDSSLRPYVQPQEKETYLAALNAEEEWLYSDEGEEATKSAYVERIEKLQKIGGPIIKRQQENDARPKAASALRETINSFLEQAQSGDEKYSHISDEDKQKVIEKCANAAKWLDDGLYKQGETPKNENPRVTVADMAKHRDELLYVCNPIMTKPKPRIPTNPAPQQEAPKKEEAPAGGEGDAPAAQGGEQPNNMDVD